MEKTASKPARSNRNKDHDDFVRGIFSYPELVLKILDYSLPPELKLFIDFATLKPLPDLHVDESLQITYSDTIYEAAFRKEMIPKSIRRRRKLPHFRFCFLGEFKSSIPDRPVDFQIGDYVRNLQLLDINNGRPPSIVIPILIYHGSRKWQFKRLYDYFAKYLPDTILEYVSNPKYIVIDLQAMNDLDIEAAIGLGELRGAFVALKHAHDKNFFQQNLKEILKFVDESPASLLFQTYLKMLMEYSQRRSKLEGEKFNKIVEQLNPSKEMGTKFRTIFDIAEEKGLKSGIEKGREEGREEGIAIGEAKSKRKMIELLVLNTRMSDAQISENVNAPIRLVETIRQELNQSQTA